MRYYYYEDILSAANKLGFDTVDNAFIHLYVKEKKSMRQIANIFSLHKCYITKYTVREHLLDNGIVLRSRGGNNRNQEGVLQYG